MDKELLTVPEVADYIKCSQSMIRKLLRNHQIPNIRLFSKILFDKYAINVWLEEKQSNIKVCDEYHGLKIARKG
jgi:excisionase family DNA binding protein